MEDREMVYGFEFETPDLPEDRLEKASLLQNMIITVAQNGSLDESVYAQLRREFMEGETSDLLPDYIRTCRD